MDRPGKQRIVRPADFAVERANALRNKESERTRELRTVKQFKEKKVPREGKCSTQATARADPHEGGRATTSLSHLYYT